VEAQASRARVLAVSVVVVATAGMMYELALATLASYILGNTVTQFSLTLGIYLSAMGVGAMVSGRMNRALVARFVMVETAVALLGGSSATVLFLASAHPALFRPTLYAEVFSIGALVGLELPLLLRLLREDLGFDESVAKAMTYDYVGSLVASLLFPLVLMPLLGLVRSAALAGIMNAVVAWVGGHLLVRTEQGQRLTRALPVLAAALLAALFFYGEAALAGAEG
jgi:spermidine synthase